jgi:hypothetical protein
MGVPHFNYKKILDLLRQLGEYHEQIQSWGQGSIQQLIYDVESRLKEDNTDHLAPYYPLMWVVTDSVKTDGRESTYEFSILVMDIMNTKNFDNQTDVLSDCLDILKDVVAQLKYSSDECYCQLDLDYPIDMTPFEEQYDDYVAGWTAKIRIRVPDAINRCIAPYSTFPPCDQNFDC